MTGEHSNTKETPSTDRRSSHTPGPWSVECPIDGELTIVEANKPTHEWKFIASIYLREGNDPDEFPHHVSEANARLMGAAPDLFEVVRDLVEYGGAMEYDDWRGLVQRAETALVKVRLKAEGQS